MVFLEKLVKKINKFPSYYTIKNLKEKYLKRTLNTNKYKDMQRRKPNFNFRRHNFSIKSFDISLNFGVAINRFMATSGPVCNEIFES